MGLAQSSTKALSHAKPSGLNLSWMFDGERLRNLMATRRLSQSELARRVGVSQTTIAKLVAGRGYGSKHLHRIARELQTTAAFLTGEIDDPDEHAPPPPPTPVAQMLMMPVAFPCEAALTEMFEGLLTSLPEEFEPEKLLQAGLAHELATLLPIGLAAVRGPLMHLPGYSTEPVPRRAADDDEGHRVQRRA